MRVQQISVGVVSAIMRLSAKVIHVALFSNYSRCAGYCSDTVGLRRANKFGGSYNWFPLDFLELC